MARLLPGVISALLLSLMLGTGAAQAHCEGQGGPHTGAPASRAQH